MCGISAPCRNSPRNRLNDRDDASGVNGLSASAMGIDQASETCFRYLADLK